MPPRPDSDFKGRLQTLLELVESEGVVEHDQLRDRLTRARAMLQGLLAQRFEGSFNEHLASLRRETLKEKQELCRAANEELHELGLAIRCPKTNEATTLVADFGHDREAGRFQLSPVSREPGQRRTLSFSELQELELMERPERREYFRRYWQQALKGRGPSGRAR